MFDSPKKALLHLIVVLSLLSSASFVSAQQRAMHYFVDGVEAFEDGSYQQAMRWLETAIELEPTNLEFHYYLGLTFGAMKRYEDALEVFESMVEEEPVKFRKAYFEIAAIYSKQGQYQKAIDTLSIVEEIDPKEPRVYLEKGYAYQKLTDYEQAIEHFNKAKELEPKMAQVLDYNIAAVYFDAEEFDRAEQIFTKVIELDPTTATAEHARQSIVNVRGAKRARRALYLAASFSWSYDDNVLLKALEQAAVVSATGESLDESDQFQSLLFRGGYKFVNRKDLELGAGYTLYCTGYKELTDNNVLGHIPHLYVQGSHHPFYFRIQYELSSYRTGGKKNGQDQGFFLTFGSDSEKKLTMHSLMPTLTIVEPHNLRSEITLSYQDKDYLDEFTSDASQYSLGITQYYKFPNTELYPRVGYKYGSEDANEDIYSYRYHQLLLGLSSPICWGIQGDVSLSYEKTDFNRNPFYALTGEREDTKYIFSFSIAKPLTDIFQLAFSYSYTRNESNVTSSGMDPYEFKKNVYGLMIAGMF
jgi:tetratricopeptide (TPR) repeat protein